MSHIPRKRFGQHFLIDTAIIDQIISAINPKPSDNLVEIGPGLGALTLPILKKVNALHAIELDRDLALKLESNPQHHNQLKIHQEDALKFDFSTLGSPSNPLRIFGNLPYNISTPLLFHLLSYANCVQDMHFMLQKEVVERLAASPHSSAYGRLSIMVQYRCAVTQLLSIPSAAFSPPPKVESAIVRLIPYHEKPFQTLNEALFEQLVKHAFGKRRKTLKNALKNFVPPEVWKISTIDNTLRPETLSIKDYVELSNELYRYSTT